METFAHGLGEVSQEPSGASERRGGEGRASAKGKGESYFWLLSRKSNLRSLTPKELQMHGRQHTGVSIYEARTETGEKDEGSGRRVTTTGEAPAETAADDGKAETDIDR